MQKPQSMIRAEKEMSLQIAAQWLHCKDLASLRTLAQEICDTYDELFK